MTTLHQQKKNNWRKRFFVLCIINVVILISLLIYLYSPIPEKDLQLSGKEYTTENSSEFVIRTTKQNLNNLVNAYLNKLLLGTNHQYYVNLDDDLQLLGELPVFSTTVPLLINSQPNEQYKCDNTLQK